MAHTLVKALALCAAILGTGVSTQDGLGLNATVTDVYPTPEGVGAGTWELAYAKARALVSQMSLEEMNNLTNGFSTTANGCSGISGGVPRLGFDGFCLQDAGNGVRGTDGVSSYASGISVGASWNATLAHERAKYMGAEFKTKGANVALGPVVGPLGRIASGGRNWEGMSNDPYLAGILGAETVKGLQKSVIACVKHFIGNEQETHRTSFAMPSASMNIPDQAMHELYLWPFQDLVEAGAGSIMCSYNRLNNTYACENSGILNGLLKTELNFQGFVVTDWGAEHSGLPEANAGLDMVMPRSAYWSNGSLAAAVQNGTFDRTRLQDMATRIVAAWYLVEQDSADYPKLGIGMPPSLLLPHQYVNAKDPAALPEIRQQAVEGHVLVKNVNNTLPLKKTRCIVNIRLRCHASTQLWSSIYWGNSKQHGHRSLLSQLARYWRRRVVVPDILIEPVDSRRARDTRWVTVHWRRKWFEYCTIYQHAIRCTRITGSAGWYKSVLRLQPH